MAERDAGEGAARTGSRDGRAATDRGAPAGLSFEEALSRLEEIVGRLEAGDLPLEETIAAFEEGQVLLRACGDHLEKAELRVKEVLRQADGTLETADWADEADGPAR